MDEREQTPPEGREAPLSAWAVASLVLGLIGLLVFMVPIAALVLSLAAIACGGIGLNQISDGRGRGTGLAAAGLALGIIGLVVAAYMLQQPPAQEREEPEREEPAEIPRRERPPDQPENEAPSAPEEPETEEPGTTPPEEEPGAEAPEPPQEEPAQQWTTVLELSGSADRRSDLFELEGGGRARLTYDVKGDDASVTIYVIEEGESSEGAPEEAVVNEPGSDTTFLTKEPGRYFLEVDSSNADWRIKIEEER